MSQAKAEDMPPLQPRPRATTALQLNVPTDVLAEVKRVAQHRDMSVDALLKLYIGQGLRQDTARLLGERVLNLTADVLARQGQSQE